MRCPTCKQEVNNFENSGWQPTTQFNSVAATPWAQSSGGNTQADYYRQQPARPADLVGDVLVPLAQAFISGLAIMPISMAILSLSGYQFSTAAKGGAIVGGVVFCGMWFLLLKAHRKLLWAIEEITNSDLNQDGYTGQPQLQRVQLEVTHKKEGAATSQKILEFPKTVTPFKARRFCEIALTDGISESSCTGGGKPISKKELKEIWQQFLNLGYGEWLDPHNHSQGRELTAYGRAALQAYVERGT